MRTIRYGLRGIRVWWAFLPLLVSIARDRRRFFLFGGRRHPSPGTRRERADTLVEILLTLGPTFIKLGQLLSTRPDILPPVYIERLSQLQDDVPPASWDETETVIESSLGPVHETFSDFDTAAISGASLGQVYRAEIDGEPVAVKVRRPGVTKRVETDLRVLSVAVRILVWVLDDARSFSLENLADEFAKVIREEMDYIREREILEEIRANFADDPAIHIPRSVDSHSTDRVLTMEYVDGIKITDVDELDANGIDRSEIARTLERTYLEMVIEDGVFHADPHPGNLAVQPDGTIVFYDFGMSGRVDQSLRDQIVDFYLAVAERDIEGILDALIAMGTLSPTADRQVMGEVLRLAIKDASGEAIDEWRVQQLVARVESTMYEFPLRLPSRMALVLRVATVVEGVCVTLDPDFDFVSVATEFLRDRGYRDETIRQYAADTGAAVGQAGLAAIRAAPTAARVVERADRGELSIRSELEDPNDLLDVHAKRLSVTVLTGAAGVSAAIIYAIQGLDPGLYVAGGLTVLGCFWLLVSYRTPSRVAARPQFTRQNLRERQKK